MLSLDDFKPITLEDKKLFDAHYARYPPTHSDNLFTSLISWMHYIKSHYTILEDTIVLMTIFENKVYFRSPIGKHNTEIFREILHLAKREGSDIPFGHIDTTTQQWMTTMFPKLALVPDRDLFDYVYVTSDLVDLKGQQYMKIRNRLNQFKKTYPYTIETISEKNMQEIRAFLKRWCLWKDCASDPQLENEKIALLYSMDHFFDLGLSGIVLRIGGNIEALSIFETMPPDMAVIHYEKAVPTFNGIYQAINMEAAKFLVKEYRYINRESDLGMQGLRQAKMSYHPHHMIEIFHIEKKNIEV